jgi:hypothetical protein
MTKDMQSHPNERYLNNSGFAERIENKKDGVVYIIMFLNGSDNRWSRIASQMDIRIKDPQFMEFIEFELPVSIFMYFGQVNNNEYYHKYGIANNLTVIAFLNGEEVIRFEDDIEARELLNRTADELGRRKRWAEIERRTIEESLKESEG